MNKSLNIRYKRLLDWRITGSHGSLKSHLVKGSIGTFALQGCGMMLQLTTGILLARYLGAAGYGTYAFVMAIVAFMTIPTAMGLPNLIVRNIAVYRTSNQHGLMRGLLIKSNWAVLIASILIAGAAFSISMLLAQRIDPAKFHTLLIALFLLPLLSLMNLRMAALRGLKHVVLGIVPETIVRPMLFVLIIVLCKFITPFKLSPESAMVYQVIATGIAFLIGAFFLIKLLPEEVKTTVSRHNTKEWIKSALPFLFVGTMQLVNRQTDIIMLGLFRSAEEVGVYRAVAQGSFLVAFVLSVVNAVLSPTIAELYARREEERLQRVVTISARAIFAGTLPIALVFIFAGEWLLGKFFGKEFMVGASALSILCACQLFNASMGSVGVILNMTGNEKDTAKGIFVAALMNITFNAILIPKFGINGAAIASGTSLISWNLLMFYWVLKKIGLVSTAFKLKS